MQTALSCGMSWGPDCCGMFQFQSRSHPRRPAWTARTAAQAYTIRKGNATKMQSPPVSMPLPSSARLCQIWRIQTFDLLPSDSVILWYDLRIFLAASAPQLSGLHVSISRTGPARGPVSGRKWGVLTFDSAAPCPDATWTPQVANVASKLMH